MVKSYLFHTLLLVIGGCLSIESQMNSNIEVVMGYWLLNDPKRDDPNSESDENDESFMGTVPPNLDRIWWKVSAV